MFSTLTSAFCSLFSYEALSYTVPQLPQASLDASDSILSTLIFFILLISGCGLISLQMRRVVMKNVIYSASPATTAIAAAVAVVEDVHMAAIDGHNNLNQKGKPPEESKIFSSARVLPTKNKPPQIMNFAKLSDHQKARRRVYNHLEADDPKCFSLKDIAIENEFNQILRRNSNGSIKELPAVQPRSPLVFEQCSKIDLIKKAAAGKSISIKTKANEFSFKTTLKSYIKI